MSEANQRRRPVTDIVLFVALFLCALKYTWNLEQFVDLGLYDETSYLSRGLQFLKERSAGDAPVYAGWYFLLHLFEKNPVSLYYLNYKLMTLLSTLVLYLLARRYNIAPITALCVSIVFLISQANLPAWPKVSHLALILFAVLLIVLRKNDPTPVKVAMGVFFSILISYVRPEYFLTLILCCIFLILLIPSWLRQLNRKEKIKAVVPVIAALLLYIGIGNPWAGSRSYVAFGQAYAENRVRWNNDSINPATNWVEITQKDFGKIDSIADAFFKAPGLFGKHIVTNVAGTAREFLLAMFPAYMPVDRISKLILIIILFCFIIYRFQKTVRKENRFTWLMIGLFALPAVVSCILIAPRQRYLLVTGIPAMVLAVTFVSAAKKSPMKFSRLLLAGLLALSLTPIASKYASQRHDSKRENFHTIQFLKSLKIQPEVNLLSTDGSYDVYLGNNYHSVAEYEKNAGLKQFFQSRQINMIIVSESLNRDSRFVSDPEWLSFSTDYAVEGFVKMPIPGTDRVLLVDKKLL